MWLPMHECINMLMSRLHAPMHVHTLLMRMHCSGACMPVMALSCMCMHMHLHRHYLATGGREAVAAIACGAT